MSAIRFAYAPLDATVVASIRSNAVRYTARWKGAELHLSVPAGERYEDIMHALGQMTPRLLQRKSDAGEALLHTGMRLPIDGGRMLYIESSGRPGCYYRKHMPDDNNIVIALDTDIDVSSPEVQRDLSRVILKVLKVWVYPLAILPAMQIASRLGLKVDDWAIGKGSKTLGRCKVERTGLLNRTVSRITLSSAITLMPAELREYIIYHELAHLTHMNHSPEFHALLDKYTGGRDAELDAKLKAFRWPIVRT